MCIFIFQRPHLRVAPPTRRGIRNLAPPIFNPRVPSHPKCHHLPVAPPASHGSAPNPSRRSRAMTPPAPCNPQPLPQSTEAIATSFITSCPAGPPVVLHVGGGCPRSSGRSLQDPRSPTAFPMPSGTFERPAAANPDSPSTTSKQIPNDAEPFLMAPGRPCPERSWIA